MFKRCFIAMKIIVFKDNLIPLCLFYSKYSFYKVSLETDQSITIHYDPDSDTQNLQNDVISSIQYGTLKYFGPWDIFWSGSIETFRLLGY